jgi:Txe/YoeB family toxin of toxin-antitoxin system
MSAWAIVYTPHAREDWQLVLKCGQSSLPARIRDLLVVIREDPFSPYPPFKRLTGDLQGAFSRRINLEHRLVYRIYEDAKVVQVLSCWYH